MDFLVIRKEVKQSFPVHKRQEMKKKILKPHEALATTKIKKNRRIQVIDVEI